MGWTSFSAKADYKGRINRKKVLDEQFTSDNDRYSWKVRKSVMVGTTYYSAISREDKETQDTFIFGMVALTSVDNSQWDNFAYKEMDETMGPCCYECPESILKLLSPTEDKWSNEWRQACKANNQAKKERRKAMKAFEIGDKIKTKLWYEEERILELSMVNNQKKWVDWSAYVKFNQKSVFEYPFEKVEVE